MIIANGINFDNTLSVHNFAKSPEAQKILNDNHAGSEKQYYTIGQKVNSNGIQNAIITDVYKENGYMRYVIEHCAKRKTYTHIVRQCDIEIIE